MSTFVGLLGLCLLLFAIQSTSTTAAAAITTVTNATRRELRGRPHNHSPPAVRPWRELLLPKPPPGAGLPDSAGPVDLKIATQCLKLSPGTEQHLSYPDDAEAHFEAIRQATKAFAQSAPGFRPHQWSGYGGPWIENAWIDHFEKKWAARTSGRWERVSFFSCD